MKTSTIAWIVVILVILIGGWYIWMQSSTPAPASTATTSTVSTSTTSTTGTSQATSTANNGTSQSGDGTSVSQNLILGITAGSGDVANFLSAYNGMTLYTYSPDSDTPGQSSCTGTCAQNWPPYTVQSSSDINVPANIYGTVATIARADGSLQVTYNGKPLYFYAGDKNPGDAKGEGIGGVWYVAKP